MFRFLPGRASSGLRGKSRSRRSPRLQMEPLESRVLLNAGDLDVVFDGDGEATTALGFGSDQVHALAIQPDSKIVAVGQAAYSDSEFAVARYNLDGSLDASFGLGGEVLASLSAGTAEELGDPSGSCRRRLGCS